jgi:hypothetical protein
VAYHDEASDTDRHDDHVEDSSLTGTISNPADNDSHRSRNGVWRNRQKLCLSAGVSHSSKDGGEEQRESVQGHQTSHVDHGEAPTFPVLEGGGDVAAVVLLSSVGLVVGSKAATHTDAVLRRQETSSAGPIKDHPPAEAANEHGSETLYRVLGADQVIVHNGPYLENEDPSPSIHAANAVHQRNRGSKETAKGASQCCSGEEQSSTETKLRSLVPAGEVVVHALVSVRITILQRWNRIILPGKRPASARPRRNLQARRAG